MLAVLRFLRAAVIIISPFWYSRSGSEDIKFASEGAKPPFHRWGTPKIWKRGAEYVFGEHGFKHRAQ